jgi:hypothetical protein
MREIVIQGAGIFPRDCTSSSFFLQEPQSPPIPEERRPDCRASHRNNSNRRAREEDMKRLITLTLALASMGFFGLGSNLKTDTAVQAMTPQLRIQIGPRRNRRWENRGERVGYGYGRTVVQTRLVQRGWHTYRETYRTTYFPNGQTQTLLISRVRVD